MELGLNPNSQAYALITHYTFSFENQEYTHIKYHSQNINDACQRVTYKISFTKPINDACNVYEFTHLFSNSRV